MDIKEIIYFFQDCNLNLPFAKVKDILGAISEYPFSSVSILTFLFFLLFILGVLLLIYYYSKRIRQRKDDEIHFSERNYKQILKKRGFTLEEIALIDDICLKYKVEKKGEFFSDRTVYNNLVKKYIYDYVTKLNDKQQQDIYSHLGQIRIRSNFDRPKTGSSFQSTHELEINKNLLLEYQQQRYSVVVLENIEPYFIISKPENASEIPNQSEVKVSFWRPKDGYYDIDTVIVKNLPKPLFVYCLKHINNISQSYHREFLRADTQIPCQFHSVVKSFVFFGESEPSIKGKGIIINISGGGLAFYSEAELTIDSYISMDFELSKNSVLNELKGIINKIDKRDHDYVYHVIFIGLSNELLDKIINYTQNM